MNNYLIFNGNKCEYIKLDTSIEFFCGRCGKRKIARKFAKYTDDGKEILLCNGCYGKLLSEQKQTKM